MVQSYLCRISYQKADDYQTAGGLLQMAEDFEKAREELLNKLYDVDNNAAGDITIEDIHEYLEDSHNNPSISSNETPSQ